MPTLDELHRHEQDIIDGKSKHYQGQILYRGHEIRQQHSIRRVAKTLHGYVSQTQFCGLQLIGSPGSGKTTLAVNVITDFVEIAEKNNERWNVEWAGGEELRELGDYIDNLQKGGNHIIIFDDVSQALQQISTKEQAQVMESLTTTRHVTGGKLIIVSLFHYSYFQLKGARSQNAISIYTSVSLPELGNISAQLGNNKQAKQKLKNFAKIYQSSMANKKYRLHISNNQEREFITGEPFRPCFVISITQAHLALFLKLENGFVPNFEKKGRVDSKILISKMVKAYGQYGKMALRTFCMLKNEFSPVPKKQALAWSYLNDLKNSYGINTKQVAELLTEGEVKKVYRPRQAEKELTKEIIKESSNIQ